VEEVKERCNVSLENDDVYMATSFDELIRSIVLIGRGIGTKKELVFDAVSNKI